jgi:hypothetical protein
MQITFRKPREKSTNITCDRQVTILTQSLKKLATQLGDVWLFGQFGRRFWGDISVKGLVLYLWCSLASKSSAVEKSKLKICCLRQDKCEKWPCTGQDIGRRCRSLLSSLSTIVPPVLTFFVSAHSHTVYRSFLLYDYHNMHQLFSQITLTDWPLQWKRPSFSIR